MRTAIIYLKHNLAAAERVRHCVGGELICYDKEAFKTAFCGFDAVIAVMACGIAVRDIAPLLGDKWSDPPIVVVDAALKFAVALSGGHHGANELARSLAEIGVMPVITTASEVLGRRNVEHIARELDCDIVNRDSTRVINSYLLGSDLPVFRVQGPGIVVVDPDVSVLQKKSSTISGIVVGIGTRQNVRPDDVVHAINSALDECGISLSDVELFASAQIKENEAGLIDAVRQLGGHIVFIPADVINTINPPSASRATDLGLTGVCEPAALALSRENTLIMRKKVYNNVTIAIAR